MDNYGNRGSGSKHSSTKHQTKTFSRNVGRSLDEEQLHNERDRTDERSDYYSKKPKKPDQQYYQEYQKQQQNPGSNKAESKARYDRPYDNRPSRQGSEPRAGNNNFSNHDSKMSYATSDRGRDTRSSEPYEHRNKPPSGQSRINNVAFTRIHPNLEHLPPRLKKKYLADAGLPEDYVEKPIMESYSNTLPSGRGRNNRYDQQSYQSKYNNQNSYQSKYNNQAPKSSSHEPNYHYRSLTPPPSKNTRPPLQQQPKVVSPRYEWKSNDVQKPDDSSPSKTFKEEMDFDWSEDVMNSQSLPHDVNSAPNVHNNKFEDSTRHRRRRRNRSTSSNGSVERSTYNPNDAYQNINNNNNFKLPFPKPNNRQRRNSQSSYNSRENSTERGHAYASRENSLDRRHHRRNRYNGRRGSDYHSSRENSTERFANNWPRNDSLTNLQEDDSQSWRNVEESMSSISSVKTDQKIAELTKEFKNSVELSSKPSVLQNESRTLFDPNNPTKPIIVAQPHNRTRDFNNVPDAIERYSDHQQYLTSNKPDWLNKSSEQYRNIRNKQWIDELDRLDYEISRIIDNGNLLREWNHCQQLREKVQKIFEGLLTKEMKFCQTVHVEHYFWRLLFYRIIEVLRKQILECDEASRASYKEKALETVEGGTKYLESLIKLLESQYSFRIDDYIGENAASFRKGLEPFTTLALVSAQKIFLFLGDLARYREHINQTNNFGRAKNFYVKAQQVVPKNGKPFNQLALLAVYSKRKIDAVYYYMRSLMSESTPFFPAKESLVALFDEIRKKYEFSQRKREEKNRLRLKDKEHRFDGNLRKETWIHPEDGCRVYRTAPLDPALSGRNSDSSDDEELTQMDPLELNKRFVVSFLHVQGKLITKVGMESFRMCAVQMLKEFRALLQISPITINTHRLLQLISLNMYSITCTELKDPNIGKQVRSEVQECAISIGLLMFGIILERFIVVLKESITVGDASATQLNKAGSEPTKDSNNEPRKILTLNEDSKVMLPAIKAWCDWMMFHVKVWNPPPFCSDYKISATSNHDPWNGLATLMTLLETIADTNKDYLSVHRGKDYELVRLQEDVTLAGFSPLKENMPDPIFCRCDIDIEIAQNVLRLQKLMFFGKSILCECDKPILKKTTSPTTGKLEFVSVVQNRTDSTSDSELLLESFSDEEADKKDSKEANGNKFDDSLDLKTHHDAAEIRRLLRRKDELERKQKMEQKYNERLQDILSQSTVALHIEVRPRYLIPDTNCFVDDLISIKAIASAHPLYQLMIPITVINELEGLRKGIKPLTSTGTVGAVLSQQLVQQTLQHTSSRARSRNEAQHAAFVAQASAEALAFLNSKNPAVKSVTSKGTVITSTIFTSEEGDSEMKSNDDRILETALQLCKNNVEEKRGEVRHLLREVVLLTTDRNLRVKAITNDIPVRELRDFVKWAGLGAFA